MTSREQPTTAEALAGLVGALEDVAGEVCAWKGSYDDCAEASANPAEDFDAPCPACRARAALSRWRDRAPARDDRYTMSRVAAIVGDLVDDKHGRILDAIDAAWFHDQRSPSGHTYDTR